MLSNVVRIPFWTYQLFTKAKSFKANAVIGSPLLNRLGLHVVRLLLAHGVARFKWLLLSPCAPRKYRRDFQKEGFVLLENFLPPQEFQQLEEGFANCQSPVRECVQGDTLTHRIFLDAPTAEQISGCRSLLANRLYQRLLAYCSGRLTRPHFYVQCVKNHFVAGGDDPQKVMHSDTFHPNIKAWLFVSDVDESNGPFTYVPSSNRLTWRRIKWEYARSLVARDIGDGYSEKGSFRVSNDDLERLGLPQPVGFKVRRNTLVIANTFGFHGRGPAAETSNRYALYATSRGNPFNPFPGVSSRYLARISQHVAQAFWLYQDNRAAKRNSRSSWHIVPSEDFHSLPAEEPEPRQSGE